ncbi:biopolymer transporter ExbD [Myxococcota bacterium]|nr:biopolymer transporter ExbD [Myxococcota bacterium]MBU1432710.1 biopolymer transporter ExbD [Myxococcota bacterium]
MGGGGGKRKAVSEINVTPLVDVMLVLLVVFMVTTPMIVEVEQQRKVEVDLPTTNAEPVKAAELETIVILSKDLKVQLDLGQGASDLADCAGFSVQFDACLEGLEEKLKGNPKLQEARRVFLMADRGLPYGFVVDVMARMKRAGINNLGMVTNPPGEAP